MGRKKEEMHTTFEALNDQNRDKMLTLAKDILRAQQKLKQISQLSSPESEHRKKIP